MLARAFLLVVLISSSPSWIFPRVVATDEAMRAAERMIRIENVALSSRTPARPFSLSTISLLYYDSDPVAYLVTLDPTGFMILSDVTELAPVRFISYDSSFPALRGHALIQYILEESFATKQRLGYLRSLALNPRLPKQLPTSLDQDQLRQNEALWSRGTQSKAAIDLPSPTANMAPLLTSRWNQGAPYNKFTPTLTDSSGHTVSTWTGCSATAQAQIMYYWKHPASGQGSHSYYWVDGKRTLSIMFGYPYDWDAMADTYTYRETPQQEAAVATLMRDVGYSIDMQYGLDGSAAGLNDNNSLVAFFNYSPEVAKTERMGHPTALSWFNVFKRQLDNYWPALLAIYTPRPEGHAVVVDGYRTDNGNQVHINMGWSGSSDSYYSLDSIADFTLTSYQYAIINIHPPVDTLGPTLVIDSVNDGDAFAGPTVTISGSASDAGRGNSGVASVTVQGVRASGDIAAGSDRASWRRTVTLNPGANVITVVARDASSRQNATSQSITLHYVEHPSLFINANAVSLTYEIDSFEPPKQRLLVTSFPRGLAFSVHADDSPGWLTANPSSGIAPAYVTVSANPNGLATGIYNGSLVFESAAAQNAPQIVEVGLTVRLAKLSIDPSSICFYGRDGADELLMKEIRVGRSTPGLSLVFTASIEAGSDWLSLGGIRGGATPNTIRAFARPAGREGVYDGSITVRMPESGSEPEKVPVSLNIRNRPTVLVRPSLFRFSCASGVAGCAPLPQTLSVFGDRTSFKAHANTGSGWLRISSENAASPSVLTVSANGSGLAPGRYDGTISIVAPESMVYAQDVDVRLDITQKTIPLVTPDAVSLQAQYGSHLPVSETVSVYTNGKPFEINASKKGEAWLSFNVIAAYAGSYDGATGAILPTPGSVQISADPTGLLPGTYSGQILVATDGASAAVVIPIELRVLPNTLMISQIADGGDWNTVIDIVNTDSEVAAFTIKFWNQDGSPLPLPLAGIGKISEYSGAIPVNGTVTLQTAGLDPAVSQGWAEIIAERSVGGAAIFRHHAKNGDSEATVPISPPIGKRFLLPFDNAHDFSTGIALVNTGSAESTLSVELRDQNGLKIGSDSLLLARRSQKAFLLYQAFPQIAGLRGVAEFSSSTSELAALGLRLSPRGTFTSFQPAVPLSTPESQITTRMVPQIADGGEWKTTFVLANLDTAPAAFSIAFHKPDGNPMSLSLPGLETRTEYADIIPAGGLRVLETDATSASVAQGWAEIVSSRPVAGTVVFSQKSISGHDSEGTVQIAPPVGERFVLPFDNTQGFLTAMALLNQSSSDDYFAPVTLRDENGQRLGVEYLQLSANSRQVFYLADRFPKTVNRRGTIEFGGAAISVLGLRFNPLGSFTSVPPIRK